MNNSFDTKAITWDTPDKIARAEVFATRIGQEISATDQVALEYGAGTGLVSFCLKDKFANITLADSSVGMLEVAQQKIVSSSVNNMSVLQADLTQHSLSNKFDVIYSLLTMHHITDTKNILSQFYDHLIDDGKLIIADLDSEDGAFHGEGFDGHNGFDREYLVQIASEVGYRQVSVETLTTILRQDLQREYSVFVLIATK